MKSDKSDFQREVAERVLDSYRDRSKEVLLLGVPISEFSKGYLMCAVAMLLEQQDSAIEDLKSTARIMAAAAKAKGKS